MIFRIVRVPIRGLVLDVSVAVPEGPDTGARLKTAGIVTALAVYRRYRLNRLAQEAPE